MKTDNFYVIQSFMMKDLKLKPNEALIYAIIYGFSQDNQTTFRGSIRYLMENTNLSKQTILNILKDLTQRKYIIKFENINNGVKFCEYKANLDILGSKKNVSMVKELDNPESIPMVQNLDGGSQKNIPNPVQNLDWGGTNFRHNNIEDNIDNNIKDNIEPVEATPQAEPITTTEKKLKEVKHKHGEYNHVLLTDKQYNSLVEKYGSNIIDDYIKKIDEWIQLKGKSPYKDFNLAIQNWLKKDNIQPIQVYNYDNNQDLGGWW
ncbi:MAG: helix-turn-helix domain-containing protein [Ruminococcus sp.]|nr:helix-turn-helix domain-containing protein [Ruminococcus sp.]